MDRAKERNIAFGRSPQSNAGNAPPVLVPTDLRIFLWKGDALQQI